MGTKHITMRVLAGLTLLGGVFGGRAAAQVKPEDLRKPAQAGVAVTTPAPAELATCRADQVQWPKPAAGPAPSGVVIKDAQGRTLRQFIDTTGTGRPNIWSFYLNGVESYREVDGNGDGKPDQYRWFGPNGSKWGIDIDQDGVVDTWHMISPEEVGQELFAAMTAKDAKKVEALLPSEQDLKSLGMPDAEIAKVRARTAGAVKRMMETADALKLSDKAKFVHLELTAPSAIPADTFGGREDMLKYRSATVLVDKGDGKTADVFQTGELILIGRAWKLIDGPTPGAAPAGNPGDGPGVPPLTPEGQKLLAEMENIQAPADRAEMPKYHLARAVVLEKIVAVTQGEAQQPWLKQVVDAYAAAAEAGDATALQRLGQWITSIEKSAPKSPAATYAAFRALSAENTVKLAAGPKTDDVVKIQAWWREQLEAFVAKYPTAEEAPEAMMRLAVAHEFANKDAEAKAVYEALAKNYATHPYATKAIGAVKRLGSEGQPFVLSGTTVDGKAFSMAQLAGKGVVVYYYANWGTDATPQLKQLAELLKLYGPKGLEVVTISLDDDPAKAVQAINAAQLPGAHLHMPGGLDRSPLATAYGIQMVPHVFVVGKDGKVINRNAQNGPSLKDEIEKMLK
ncbi:redoxin domain-containing protein [Fimbriiglobus ruber]|uniref:Thiol:disulfide interchange protein n=1 Tax=Fimbriiglobus ruber TaxID=1908690 RepID=A0A225D989_9BACT|nr:redoxin domain-containing protein [Fimbriiglobus ruber]OWK36224.1 Thiol:disulfide interchange protein [Fimbriiglobus ruber]